MVDFPANHDWLPEGTVHLCNRFGIPNQQRFCWRTNLDHWCFDIPCTGDAIPVSFRLFASPTNLVYVTLPTELQGGIPYRVYIYIYLYIRIYIYNLPQILVIKKPTLKNRAPASVAMWNLPESNWLKFPVVNGMSGFPTTGQNHNS